MSVCVCVNLLRLNKKNLFHLLKINNKKQKLSAKKKKEGV